MLKTIRLFDILIYSFRRNQAQVAFKVDKAIHWILDSVFVLLTLIGWIAIYSVESVHVVHFF